MIVRLYVYISGISHINIYLHFKSSHFKNESTYYNWEHYTIKLLYAYNNEIISNNTDKHYIKLKYLILLWSIQKH